MGEAELELIGRGMGFADDGDIPSLLELVHPEIEWRPPAQGTLDDVYAGRDGVRRLFEQLTEAWDSIEHRPIEIVEANPETIVITNLRLHAQASGLNVDEVWGYAIEVRDAKLFRVAMYTDTEQAIRAHGAESLPRRPWPF
jgi:ketosteroid isomerase-like protein